MNHDMEIIPIVPTQQEEEWMRRQDWIVHAIIAQFNIAPQILGIDGYIVESTAIVLPNAQVLLPELTLRESTKDEH